jgi:NTP pyrophosphatase (non-canonical NTP hydrolase)
MKSYIKQTWVIDTNKVKDTELIYKLVSEIDMKSNVLEWAKERDLLHNDNHTKQFMKLVEEVGELSNAILKDDKAEQIDALGDIQVVLIILAEQLGFDLDTCLESAYNEIKNRKGKTINGSFIKD